MYIPTEFQINDENIIYDVIETNSFATLFYQQDDIPQATHLPLTLDREKGFLYGHFARSNAQWKGIEDREILIVFQGPHSYISPSWYETKTAVPTWNYVAVHVYGQVEILDNKLELMESLRIMVKKYEKPNSLYNLEEVDPNYIEGMSKGIVGFRIKITKIEGKWKLSQNHSIERQKLIIAELEKIPSENTEKIGYLMKENLRNKA